jgi:hypothetical protein
LCSILQFSIPRNVIWIVRRVYLDEKYVMPGEVLSVRKILDLVWAIPRTYLVLRGVVVAIFVEHNFVMLFGILLFALLYIYGLRWDGFMFLLVFMLFGKRTFEF